MPYEDVDASGDLPSSWELLERAESVLDQVRYAERGTYTGTGENGPGVSLVILPEHPLEDAGEVIGEYADRMKWLPWGEDAEADHLSIFDVESVHYLKEYEHEFDGHFLIGRTGRIYGYMVYVTSVASEDLGSSYDGAKMRSLEGIASIQLDTPSLGSNGVVDEAAEIREFPGVQDGSIGAAVSGEVLSYDNPYGPVIGAAIRASTGEVEFLNQDGRFRHLDPIRPAPDDEKIHRRVDRTVREEAGSSPLDIDTDDGAGQDELGLGGHDEPRIEDYVSDEIRALKQAD